jgi:ribosomal protein L18
VSKKEGNMDGVRVENYVTCTLVTDDTKLEREMAKSQWKRNYATAKLTGQLVTVEALREHLKYLDGNLPVVLADWSEEHAKDTELALELISVEETEFHSKHVDPDGSRWGFYCIGKAVVLGRSKAEK